MITKIRENGREFYLYERPNGETSLAYVEIRDMEELAESLELLTGIDDDDSDAMEFAERLQSSIDAYSSDHQITIRDIIGKFCGKTIIDITQHDPEEYLDGEDPYIMLMFNDGCTLKLFCSGFVAYDSNKNSTTSFYLMEQDEEDDNDDDHDDD